MPSSALHQKLRKLIGEQFNYLSEIWQLVEILNQDDRIVIQRVHQTTDPPLQSDQYGHARRRIPETLSLAISDAEGTGYSDEVMLLLQGKIARTQ